MNTFINVGGIMRPLNRVGGEPFAQHIDASHQFVRLEDFDQIVAGHSQERLEIGALIRDVVRMSRGPEEAVHMVSVLARELRRGGDIERPLAILRQRAEERR